MKNFFVFLIIIFLVGAYYYFPISIVKPISLSSFLDLNDTPNTYVGQSGKVASVCNTEDGICFTDVNNTSGGSGTIYTSGTPATIQVNNDLNTISQNFDGNFASRFDANFWRMFALGEPYIDGNALAIVNSLDLNNSLNYVQINGDTMTGKLNTPDINTSTIHVDNNATIDKNLLVKQDLNVQNQAGFDKNINLNTGGACIKLKTTTGFTCLCGNNIDGNGGIVIYVC